MIEDAAGKIFPRNLTAGADHVVRGNPAATRPESGVENCYPGLEFDSRTLDSAFFPGLFVEFHRPDGALVRRVEPTGVAAEQGLVDDDLPLYLWAVCGRTTVDQQPQDAPTFTCTGLGGLGVWRRVRDLMPGPVAVLVGPVAGIGSPGSDPVDGSLNGFRLQARSVVQRDADGAVVAAVLVAERARILDDDGVIDPEVYQAGELTRSLCAPWQYDFRDCGCFYWAASKPDIVTSSDGSERHLNFMRSDRAPTPPAADITTSGGWATGEMTYAELVAGWQVLPVVLDDAENDAVVPPALPPLTEMTTDEVATELEYLATVEHALCVEYLFAHYSLDAPLRLPDEASQRTRQVHAAAAEVFGIAVDEMRHLRWVNEALGVLGRPVALGRAERIGRQFDRPFELAPLTPEQLDWFIDVERPSRATASDVDGMYVRLLSTIEKRPQDFPSADRIAHLLKLIIDEGDDHFQRFTSVKEYLADLDPADYLRPLDGEPDALAVELRALGDQSYAVLLAALSTAFRLGDRAGGVLLEQSRRAMFGLHETNHALAARGVAPRFALPAAPALPPIADPGFRAAVHERVGPARDAMARVS
ncbi:MAG: ferritin-like protein, partial [Actinomycetota bacterium]|nr:ferritin-like protein [Actinomycetota bacterium]